MSRIESRTCIVFAGAALLFVQAAWAQGTIRIPTPTVHIPTPTIHVPTPETTVRTPDVGDREGVYNNGDKKNSSKAGGTYGTTSPGKSKTGGAAGGGPILSIVAPTSLDAGPNAAARTGNGTTPSPIGFGVTASAWPTLWQWPFFSDSLLVDANLSLFFPQVGPPPATDVGAVYQYIDDGGDNSSYATTVAADQAAVTSAQQAQTLAAECAVNPSQTGCGSAESVQQADQNLSAAQNAYQTFTNSVGYLLWLLSLIESGLPLPAGFSDAATGAVEAALAACLASPSTCAATIANLETVLAELGVPSQVMIAGQSITVLETPSEIDQSGWFDTPNASTGPSSPLSAILSGWAACWWWFTLAW
jgi:hypothetical protein